MLERMIEIYKIYVIIHENCYRNTMDFFIVVYALFTTALNSEFKELNSFGFI